MSTQAQLAAAIESALTAAGYDVAPSADLATWSAFALDRQVAVIVSGDATGGMGQTDDVTPIAVELVAVVGNPIDHHAGQRASMTTARALRVLGEGLGGSVSARLIYAGTERERLGGPWLVRVRFNALQFDTY